MRYFSTIIAVLFMGAFLVATPAHAQSEVAQSKRATYSRLNSLRSAMAEYRERGGPPDGFKAIPNRPWRPGRLVDDEGTEVLNKLEATLQSEIANGPVVVGTSFQALGGVDTWTPADPTGDVGPNHIVVGVNSSITVFTKTGSLAPGGGTVAADVLWSGTDCQGGSNGDPIVLYDELADRWVVALVHFSRNLLCIAASATSDPLGAYHDYVFDFGTELPDYAKLGINENHLVVTAHMFGPFFNGTIFGTMDKSALYGGQSIDLVYWPGYPYGYLPVDVDGASDKTNPLFVGFQSNSSINVYEIQNVNYTNLTGNVVLVQSLSVPSVDRSVCNATRGQCIDQPASWHLESLDGRLMHRAQLRDMGGRESMVFSQTVDAGGERAGIAWYELRDTGSGWQNWQNGIYAPSDGEYRWMPSIAMNAAGDIGMSFMRTSPTVFPSVSVVGQTASEGGGASGLFDGGEITCATGSSSIDQNYKRSGDYSATVVDPVSGKFWAIQQYGYPGVWADWGVWVCEFEVDNTPQPPIAAFSGSPTSGETSLNVSFNDQSSGIPTSWNWTFGDDSTSTDQNPSHTYTVADTYDVTLTVANDLGSDDTIKVGYITATVPPPFFDHVAASQSVRYGTTSGSYTNTYADDGETFTITEEESNGNPAKRRSLGEVTWEFPVRSGKPATFYFNGWHPGSNDGDTWEISFSIDNSFFTPMFEVAAISDIGYESYPLGSTTTSSIWIRAVDTDRGQGNRSLDNLIVDHMFIQTETEMPSPPSAVTGLNAVADGHDTINLTFTDVSGANGYIVERKSGIESFAIVGSVGTGIGNYSDTGLAGLTTYTYRLGAYNVADTTYSKEFSATTGETPQTVSIYLKELAGNGTDKKRWTATVTPVIFDASEGPLSSVVVTGTWTNGGSGSSSCTTDTSGKCSMTKGTKSIEIDFTVHNLAKSGYDYVRTDNVPDSTITIVRGQSSEPVAKAGLELPHELTLRQNYPNPFNPVTILEYAVPETQHVTVSVYNALGVEVSELFNGQQEAGWHRIAFDGSNLSSGLYVVVLRGEGMVQSKTMLLSK